MTDSAKTWFVRFGDIPGVDWTCPSTVDRTRLKGHDARPQDKDWDSGWVSWPILYERDSDRGVGIDVDDLDREGSSGSSPASQYPQFTGPRTVDEQLQHLAEALELPGFPADYFHLLSEAAGYLHKIRRREPRAIEDCERLCLIALDLLRACPVILDRNHSHYEDEDEDPIPVWVEASRLLHRIHMDNGDPAEAEQVAVAAQDEFGQRFNHLLAQTRERLAALRAEDA